MSKTSNIADNKGSISALRCALGCGAAVGALVLAGTAALAQEGGIETVYVTGYRASLEKSLDIKRSTAEMVDAINAEEVGKFPDSNLAESLQRLPGVAIDRDNGEGRTITVRGLNADFTRVTLNGLEALSTAGASQAGDDPNRSRAFDFNTFASELFSNLKVYKSGSAENDEGSLGATVSLQTGHPFEMGNKMVLSAQNAWYEYGKPFNPRIAALASHTFLGGRLGILGSLAYNMRQQQIDSYGSGVDTYSYVYRSMKYKGSSSTWRYGFANPYAKTDTSHCNVSSTSGTVPSTKVAYLPYCTALQGSNATALGIVEPATSALGDGVAGSSAKNMATTLMPTLAGLNHQVLYQTRIGGTGSIQWQPTDDTEITFDGVMSSTYQKSTNYSISSTGLNRNYTSSSMNKLTATANKSGDVKNLFNYDAAKGSWGGAYNDLAKCNDANVAGYAPVSCLQATDGTQRYAYNASPYYYYSNQGTDPAAAAMQLVKYIGRPATQLVAAHVITPAAGSMTSALTTGYTDQLTLANIDLTSRADQAAYTTQFMQGSLNVSHKFSDKLRFNLELGMSASRNHQEGFVVEFNKLDSGTYNGTDCVDCYVFDASAEDDMPMIDYGFDPSVTSNWDLYKGLSNIKHYITNTTNKYRALRASFAYDLNDQFTVKAGFSGRIYDFNTAKYARAMKDNYGMPALGELQAKYGSSFTIDNLGQQVEWGRGLAVPSGMGISGFFAPNLDAFKTYMHIDCNCDDSEFGDWRVSNLFSAASTSVAGNTYKVSEHDKAGYVQVDFQDVMIFNRALRGNVGLRYSVTDLTTIGHGTVGNAISGDNHYDNILPSANLAYSLTDEMLLRASVSKAIARPQLFTMAPSITSFSLDTTNPDSNSLVIGNPKLKPYDAKTFDLGYEWYFDEGAVFAVTGFAKWIKNVPQQVTTTGFLNSFMDQDSFDQLYTAYTSVPGMVSIDSSTGRNLNAEMLACSYAATPGCKFLVTTYMNSKGGVLNGLEITYQQVLKFLPQPFDGLGINANYTLIHSRMHYIVNPESAPGAGDEIDGDAAWTGASPTAFNVTMFYDGKDWSGRDWSGRVSVAYRGKYIQQYPITGGDTAPGTTDNPIMNDAIFSRSTLNVDTSFTYNYTDNLQFRIDGLNLTNQTDNRYAFSGMPVVTRYAATGRQVFVGVRFKY